MDPKAHTKPVAGSRLGQDALFDSMEATGAAVVAAFDHNVRSARGRRSRRSIAGGQQVQGPAHVVHGEYTLTCDQSAITRPHQ